MVVFDSRRVILRARRMAVARDVAQIALLACVDWLFQNWPSTHIPLLGRGKVRDLYALDDALLLVASDRISAFDHVLGSGIPGKGKILTQISLFWFDLLSDLVPNHVITADVKEYPAILQPFGDQLEGRSMLVRRANMFPVECVARGYLAGSGWKDYRIWWGLFVGTVLAIYAFFAWFRVTH